MTEAFHLKPAISSSTGPSSPSDLVLHIEVATRFGQRFRGWMLKRSVGCDDALLLTHCASVHSCFMRFPIDVVYLNGAGTVVKVVSAMKPWRLSGCANAKHALELASGGAAHHGLRPGITLRLPSWARGGVPSRRAGSQRGSAMVEFTVIGPVLTLIGLGILQYALLFNARNLLNEATFMAGRAGSMGHARIDTVREAFVKALIPLYGGGTSSAELAKSFAAAKADTVSSLRVEILNPTPASYDKWSTDALKKRYGARAIPNSGLAFRNPEEIDPVSRQNIQDANLLKLRITYGYVPKVPLIGAIYTTALKWTDTEADGFQRALVQSGRVPVVTDVTLAMQSDPVEGPTVSVSVSMPAQTDSTDRPDPPVDKRGNATGGTPESKDDSVTDPAGSSADEPEPSDDGASGTGRCGATGCDTSDLPPSSPPGGGSNTASQMCPVNPVSTTNSVSADVLFTFGQAVLTAEGKKRLDQAIDEAKADNTLRAVTLTGHTDQIGNPGANLALSRERAAAVRDYLEANGFPSVPITVEGAGDTRPKKAMSACPSTGQAQIDCLAVNRRVDIRVTRRAP